MIRNRKPTSAGSRSYSTLTFEEVTKEINLRSKSNKWDAAQPVFI